MLCDDCKKNPAIKTYKEQFQDKTIELHLCQECADKRGLVVKKDLTPAELLQNLLKHEAVDDATVICPRCLLSFAEFKRLGRFGCGECARAFHDRLAPILARIHGAKQHIGRTPRKLKKGVVTEIFKLREELKEALQKEEYEKAAQIRDQLKKYDQSS